MKTEFRKTISRWSDTSFPFEEGDKVEIEIVDGELRVRSIEEDE